MATGVKPREEDHQFTRNDMEMLGDAMKSKHFRDMLVDYFEEVRDPANQAIYQKEMTQLEKERGYDVTFINPKGGYVIKTSVAGDRKAFINICSNDNVDKPSCSIKEVDGRRGMNWLIPYSLIPPREDFDHKREKCVIYDVVYHPDTLRMAEVNQKFRELVNNTAINALKDAYSINLDCNNFKFPKSLYKGMSTPAVIRKEDPDYKPPSEEETSDLNPELIENMYPQKNYPEPPREHQPSTNKFESKLKAKKTSTSENVTSDNGYTLPKYVIKQQKAVDMQDYTFDKDTKEYSAIPSHIVIHINLPLLSSTKEVVLDVQEKKLALVSEKPAKYKLNINLPYLVNDLNGNAKFDRSKRVLTVTLPVIQRNNSDMKPFRSDSGVDSEDFSGSQSDEETPKVGLITEMPSTTSDTSAVPAEPESVVPKEVQFLEPTVAYNLPPYTHNILDTVVAFTFHVKNSEPDSVIVRNYDNKVHIKFTSVGSGFVPVYYAALISFEENVTFESVSGEAWDNNVILQIELAGNVPQKFDIGLSEEAMTSQYFDLSISNKTEQEPRVLESECDTATVVEVTNSGTETSIVVSSNLSKNKTDEEEDDDEDDDDDDDDDDYVTDKEIKWVEDNTNEINAKSILRKPLARSLSESSAPDVASSMDYISSDCIPEESSFKKTVRFNNVIARQFYRSVI